MAISDNEDEFNEAHDVASGIISTLGLAIIAHNPRAVGQVMHDIDELYSNDPDAAIDLFKVVLMMTAKNVVELYEMHNPGWTAQVKRDLNNKEEN